jgi:hypothetical protein
VKDSLAGSRFDIWNRYLENRTKAPNPSDAEKYADPIERLVVGFLSKLGINYALDFIRPSPNNVNGVVARQGRQTLGPDGSATDTIILDWKANDKGFLVIKGLDIVMEDPIAEASVEITYKFGSQSNSPNFQVDVGVLEAGRWKFSSLVLADEDEFQVTIHNADAFASAVVSFDSEQWML